MNQFSADDSIFASIADQIESDWRSIARPEQLPPPGDWSIWLILAGRGAGKTRSGAEWVRGLAESASVPRIALVGPTAADVRDTMIEGESGLLAIAPNSNRPSYEPSKRRLSYPNGVQATLFSSEEPDRLRGPQHGAAWCDELCSWKNVRDVWDNLQFGLRLGKKPRQVITTTPKPIKLLKELVKRDGQDVVVTRGRTSDNAANLAPSFLSQIVARYEGTRLGRQELNAEILEDVAGALWTRAMIDKAREPVTLPDMVRVVVAIDPSGARHADDQGADEIGIIVAGKGADGRGYVLADRTLKASPASWGRVAVGAYHEFGADRIVAERNFGGAMVEHVIRTTDASVAFREVSASRGKVARAEPVAAVYEQGRVSHIGDDLTLLEDELCQMTGNGFSGSGSPDRADALVWALSELILTTTNNTGFLDYYAEMVGVVR
jgi:phage terminase large subunit-like protein